MGDELSNHFREALNHERARAKCALREKRFITFARSLPEIWALELIQRPAVLEIVREWRRARQQQAESGTRPKTPRLVRLAPGSRLLRLAEFLFSARDYEEFMSQPILDMQEEYAAALARGRRWKARWVRFCGYYAFFKAAGAHSIIRAIWKVARP